MGRSKKKAAAVAAVPVVSVPWSELTSEEDEVKSSEPPSPSSSPQPPAAPVQPAGPECLQPDNMKETLQLLSMYRSRSMSEILRDVDLDVDTKREVMEVFKQLDWIDDAAQCVLDAALCNHLELAKDIVNFMSCKDHWKVLRKLIGNWNSFRNRRAVRDLCVHIISLNPKAMPTLNEWAKQQGKERGRCFKGYCDMCQGDNKQFAMQYSNDL